MLTLIIVFIIYFVLSSTLLIIEYTTTLSQIFTIFVHQLLLIGFGIAILVLTSRLVQMYRVVVGPPYRHDITVHIKGSSDKLIVYSNLVLIVFSIYVLMSFLILLRIIYAIMPKKIQNIFH
jgi:hypothetical protein